MKSGVLFGLVLLLAGCRCLVRETTIPGQGRAKESEKLTILGLGKVVTNKDAPAIAVPKATKAVVVDGQLSDASWRDAPALTDFVIGRSQRPDVQTRVLVTYDNDNLYVAVINEEPNTEKLVATAAGRDGKVWNDDSVEIYVDPGATKKGNYYGFFVNSRNVIYDRTRDANWSGEWASQTTILPGRAWITEVAIPFKTLSVKPEPGFKLGLMVARLRLAGLAEEQWMYLVPCEGEAKNTAVYPVLELK